MRKVGHTNYKMTYIGDTSHQTNKQTPKQVQTKTTLHKENNNNNDVQTPNKSSKDKIVATKIQVVGRPKLDVSVEHPNISQSIHTPKTHTHKKNKNCGPPHLIRHSLDSNAKLSHLSHSQFHLPSTRLLKIKSFLALQMIHNEVCQISSKPLRNLQNLTSSTQHAKSTNKLYGVIKLKSKTTS